MAKNLLLLLLVPVVAFSAQISKTYQFSEPVIKDGKVIIVGCFVAESEFAPSIAARSVSYLLPVGHKVVSCKVVYVNPKILPGAIDVKPSIPATPKSHGPFPMSKRLAVSAHYSQNSFYPGVANGSLSYSIQYKNAIPILVAIINPSEYNPVTKQLRYFEKVSVAIETAPGEMPGNYSASPSTVSEIQAVVENPKDAESLPLTTATANDYEYLIVCKTIFANSFGEFIKFNTRRGMRTKVMTLDAVKTAVPTGTDIPERVRTYIKRQYDSCHIRFVLIASNDARGDATTIPHRGFWSKYYDHDVKPENMTEDKDIPADMYYGCLNGDWKTDSTGATRNYGFWKTEDIPAEVYVGRFCVKTTGQLTNCINKTIKYSESPVTSGINSVLLAGEFLWDSYGVLCTGSKSLANLKGDANGVCNVNNFSTYGFPSSPWTFREISHEKWPKWQEGPWVQRDSLFYTGISKNKCSWVNHNGHSSTEYAIGTVSDRTSLFYYNGQNPVVSDNTWKGCDGVISNFFFFTSGGCFNGAFDNYFPPKTGMPTVYSVEDCWAGAVTRLGTGPVAMIGNSRFGMGDNDGTDGASDRPVRWIHDAMFSPTKKFHYAGMMLAKAKESDMAKITLASIPTRDITLDAPYYGALKYTNFELNLFGDPALSLWTATPQKLTLTPSLASGTVTVDTKGPYSSVALCNAAGEIFLTQQTGLNGIATITDPILTQYIAANPNGVIKIKVKAHNYLPDSATLAISTGVRVNEQIATAISRISRIGTTLQLTLALDAPEAIKVAVYNAKGALVATLLNKHFNVGSYTENLSTAGFSNGLYYCKVSCGKKESVTKFFAAR